MLAEAYCSALVVDEFRADCIWYLWDAGIISDEEAMSFRCRLSALSEWPE